MAFGFSPGYSRELNLDDLSAKHFLALSIETVRQQGWRITYIGESGFIAVAGFSMISFGEEITLQIQGPKAVIRSKCVGSQVFDWGKNKRNITGYILNFSKLSSTLTPEELDAKYEELQPEIVVSEGDRIPDLGVSSILSFKDRLKSFSDTGTGFIVTIALVALNVLIYILMVVNGVHPIDPDVDSLVSWGGNLRSLTLDGQWWRLLTCCFVHLNAFHLLVNMYALLYIGLIVEPILGRLRFITAYLFSCIVASLISLAWYDNMVSVGASGAIFGIYGVFLALLLTKVVDETVRRALFVSIVIFIGYNLFIGFRIGETDSAAHIGGLISGALVGVSYLQSFRRKEEKDLLYQTIALQAIAVFLCCALAFSMIDPYDFKQYDAKMKDFGVCEKMALDMYRYGERVPDALLHEVKSRSVYYWNEAKGVLEDAENLHLPQVLHQQNKKLIAYCDLRLKCCRLICTYIESKDKKYEGQIRTLNEQIEGAINDVKNSSQSGTGSSK